MASRGQLQWLQKFEDGDSQNVKLEASKLVHKPMGDVTMTMFTYFIQSMVLMHSCGLS